MRVASLFIAGGLCCTIFGFAGHPVSAASPGAPTPPAAATGEAQCQKDQRWIPPGYDKNGRFRDGHCSTDDAQRLRDQSRTR